MRIVLFGDGGWATNTLLRLCDAGHAIAAVVLRTQPTDSSLEDMARALGLQLLQPHRINAPESVDCVRALGADVHLSIAYNQIFGPEIRGTAPWFLNVHAGKLPQYRGRNIINWALINGENEVGITVHVVDDGIDTGDIIVQRLIPIGWTDTYGDVLAHVVEAIPSVVTDCLGLIASGHARRHPQPAIGTYFGGRRDGDEWLDWSASSLIVYNKIRAITHPGPGARTWYRDQPATIWRASYDLDWPEYLATPGEVVGRTPAGVFVKTGNSTVLVESVQIGGEPAHTPRWPIGTRLGVDAGAVLETLLARLNSLERL
jgi:methionyl-tRNA formyltransferase